MPSIHSSLVHSFTHAMRPKRMGKIILLGAGHRLTSGDFDENWHLLWILKGVWELSGWWWREGTAGNADTGAPLGHSTLNVIRS